MLFLFRVPRTIKEYPFIEIRGSESTPSLGSRINTQLGKIILEVKNYETQFAA